MPPPPPSAPRAILLTFIGCIQREMIFFFSRRHTTCSHHVAHAFDRPWFFQCFSALRGDRCQSVMGE